jgi:hypothetical protein
LRSSSFAAQGEPIELTSFIVTLYHKNFPIIFEQRFEIPVGRISVAIASQRARCRRTTKHFLCQTHHLYLSLAARSRNFLFLPVDVGERRCAARCVIALRLTEIILEDDKDFPFISVWIMDPRFILKGVTACRLHFLSRKQTSLFPAITQRFYVFG